MITRFGFAVLFAALIALGIFLWPVAASIYVAGLTVPAHAEVLDAAMFHLAGAVAAVAHWIKGVRR